MSPTIIPTIQSEPARSDQIKLKELFDELKKNQLTFLDEAAKRIIELSTGLLGVLFAVVAFGKDFPPPYFADATNVKLAVATLTLFFLSLLIGFITVQPRNYRYYPNNLTQMEEELRKAIAFKVIFFQIASALFVIGAACLALLIGFIIL
jgi:hypothetical protein